MAALLIISADRGAGKTAVAVGIARCLNGGRKLGYIKSSCDGADIDAGFMKRVLSLPESVEEMCPDADKMQNAYNSMAADRDTVIIESTCAEADSCVQLARDINARVIFVETYGAWHPEIITKLASRTNLLGVIINKVPKSRVKAVRESEATPIKALGANLLGVIPEDRMLLAITVGQLAAGLMGKVLNSPDRSGRTVENFMLGALCVDPGPTYYGRKTAKAAVLRADRPDMQIAALETDTACLVLAGATAPPIHSVSFKAENKSVPVVITEKSVNEVVSSLEELLQKSQFGQESKLPRLSEIMRQNVDLRTICGELGVVR